MPEIVKAVNIRRLFLNYKLMMRKLFIAALLLGHFAVSFAQKEYKRIISLVPSLTQSLYYLDAQEKLVGCTSYCVFAKEDKKEIVASAVKANLEKVVSLKPDLVLASGFTDLQDIETLRRFGIKVELFQSPKSFKEICNQFIHLGKLVGKEDTARKIVAESEQKIKNISVRMKWKKKPRMFFQIGANPLFTVLPNTFMDDYMNFLDAENISKTLNKGTVSREFVIAKNPDYIFIVTMGIVGNEEKEIWSKYSSLTATRKKQIHIIESDIACQPTPITFVQTMEVLEKLIIK